MRSRRFESACLYESYNSLRLGLQLGSLDVVRGQKTSVDSLGDTEHSAYCVSCCYYKCLKLIYHHDNDLFGRNLSFYDANLAFFGPPSSFNGDSAVGTLTLVETCVTVCVIVA